MMTNRIGGLSANNAAFNWMNASNSLMGLMSFKGNLNSQGSLLSAEKNLTLGMLNNDLLYNATVYQEDAIRKARNENIKRSFSIFA